MTKALLSATGQTNVDQATITIDDDGSPLPARIELAAIIDAKTQDES